MFVAFFVVAGEVVDADEREREDETTTLFAAIFLGGKSCFRHANLDDIEKSRCRRSLFVACFFVAGEDVDAKADERERDDDFARCHFLGGKSRRRAPTTVKRVDAVCLLHFCCCRRGRRRERPTSEKEKTR